MDNNQALIPANSKKSMLILGFFNPTDLIIFITGIVITFLLLITMGAATLKKALIVLVPAAITTFLVIPIPNQHNVRTFFMNVYKYFTNRRSYYWRGWCMKYGDKE